MNITFPFALKDQNKETYFLIYSPTEYISICFEQSMKNIFHYKTNELKCNPFLKFQNSPGSFQQIKLEEYLIKYLKIFNLLNEDINKTMIKHTEK